MSRDAWHDLIDAIRKGEGPEGISIDPENPAMAYDDMDIDTPPGTKVRFTGYGGFDHQQEHARCHLVVDKFYTVERIEIGSTSSKVIFSEVANEKFNTVMFERPQDPAD